jgi:AbiU2
MIMSGKIWPENLTAAERIDHAKGKMNRVVDHFLYLLELHENNAFIVFSAVLSSQIPESFAANAFNVFQRGCHQFEIVRLCALWDCPDEDKENIRTVIKLIDSPGVLDMLSEDMRQFSRNSDWGLINPSDDPGVREEASQIIKNSAAQEGEEHANRCHDELVHAIKSAEAIQKSSELAGIMNLRDKHLAHSLTQTRREKNGVVQLMKFGDETKLLEESIPIVEALFNWVNGVSFSIADSREIDRENARLLWTGCTFTNLR